MVNPYGQIQKKKFKLTNQLVKLKTFHLFSLVRVSDGKQRPVPLPYFLLQLAPVGHVLQGVNMGGMPLAEVGEVLLPRTPAPIPAIVTGCCAQGVREADG